jgi:hypothetical protein
MDEGRNGVPLGALWSDLWYVLSVEKNESRVKMDARTVIDCTKKNGMNKTEKYTKSA